MWYNVDRHYTGAALVRLRYFKNYKSLCLPAAFSCAGSKKGMDIFMKKRPKPKQIAAIICIVLLVLLYVATLVVALLDFPGSDRLFAACLLATIGLPILLWIYIWAYGRFSRKKTIADIFPESEDSEENEEA